MERRRKVAIAAIIFLGLSGGACALNEATREERPIVPIGWTYDEDTGKIENRLVEQIKPTVSTFKDSTGKMATTYSVPNGYVYNATSGMGEKTVVCQINPRFEYPGIIERAAEQVVSLVKR